ncbi:16S rRNA (cytosine(967)-C(5))-methyltransferase RsmB [Legionella israelensis]|uniref:16S rRNA (cytosine(967)-C(5))-methyltransferase n=1 Tax=Legionella israelensis TaxID=454 RepID=A0AAX1EJC1_9GAMM|nr:16S rRNA (cytosine(967)-C(5))-methyltransferase RsmB [Legionella israelensis]QBR84894.1 16S rRNA (cytosine(967)-C(5))-methyltransferase RsmB [Legionella israelensis]
MKNSARSQAMNILLSLLKNKMPLSHLLTVHPTLPPLGKEICFGVCRYYYQLKSLADSLLQKPPKSLEVWVALLMGLYQLHYMRQPDYAVVKETVSLLESHHAAWAKALVNAVLRNSSRRYEELTRHLQQKEQYRLNHPEWLIEEVKKSWPEHWQMIIKENDAHPPMTLRVNRLKISRDDYLVTLEDKGIKAKPHPLATEAIVLNKPCDVHFLPGFEEGWVSVQDAAAQLAAHLLTLKPGMRILDSCCAPGGKTCHILETEPLLNNCVALDMDGKRLQRVKENLSRLQLSATVLQGDATHPEIWWDGKTFDRILLDAPCTATGVIRRHPDIKILRQPEDVQTIIQVQNQLLRQLWPLLSSGGRMLYATCSILPAENEQQIALFLSEYPDAKCITEKYRWGHFTDHGWQIFPGEQSMDGFFYSLLEKE